MNTLRLATLPPPPHAEYGHAKGCYDAIGHVLKQILWKNELTKKAPLARQELLAHINGNKDGWDILHELFKGCLPYLGATDFDIEATINTIVAMNGMLLANFLSKAQLVQTSIKISGLTTATNALLKRFMAQVMRCENLQALMASRNHTFHDYLRSTGNKQIFRGDSIDAIIQYLQSGNPPMRLTISDDKTLQDPSQRQMNSYGG